MLKRKAEGEPSTATKQPKMDANAAIDEDLHSRQLAVYGRDCMRRLARSRILICGINGLGAEIGALLPFFPNVALVCPCLRG